MSLSDIMSYENLTLLPQLALVIFLAAFAVIAARTFRRSGSVEMRAAARLPLEDDASPRTHDEAPRSQGN